MFFLSLISLVYPHPFPICTAVLSPSDPTSPYAGDAGTFFLAALAPVLPFFAALAGGASTLRFFGSPAVFVAICFLIFAGTSFAASLASFASALACSFASFSASFSVAFSAAVSSFTRCFSAAAASAVCEF